MRLFCLQHFAINTNVNNFVERRFIVILASRYARLAELNFVPLGRGRAGFKTRHLSLFLLIYLIKSNYSSEKLSVVENEHVRSWKSNWFCWSIFFIILFSLLNWCKCCLPNISSSSSSLPSSSLPSS